MDKNQSNSNPNHNITECKQRNKRANRLAHQISSCNTDKGTNSRKDILTSPKNRSRNKGAGRVKLLARSAFTNTCTEELYCPDLSTDIILRGWLGPKHQLTNCPHHSVTQWKKTLFLSTRPKSQTHMINRVSQYNFTNIWLPFFFTTIKDCMVNSTIHFIQTFVVLFHSLIHMCHYFLKNY